MPTNEYDPNGLDRPVRGARRLAPLGGHVKADGSPDVKGFYNSYYAGHYEGRVSKEGGTLISTPRRMGKIARGEG
jgi:hypothetical protein